MFDSTNAELLWFIVGLVLLLSELILPGFVIVFSQRPRGSGKSRTPSTSAEVRMR